MSLDDLIRRHNLLLDRELALREARHKVRDEMARRLRHHFVGDAGTLHRMDIPATKVRAHTRSGYSTIRVFRNRA